MPSSYTTNVRLEAQFTGENVNTWGILLDNTIARVDDSIAGYVALAITGNYTVQSANTNTVADEARRAHLKFTGTLAAVATITLPSVSKSYWIWNASGQTLTFTTGSGNTATVENGDILPVWCDGTNVKSITYGGYNLKDYIASMTATAGAVPGTTGNLNKFLKVTVDAAPPTWQVILPSDVSGFSANAAAVRLGSSVLNALTPGDTYNALAEVAVTSTAGSVALDFATLLNGYHLFTENTTFANPTNAKPGQTGRMRVQQHASAAKTGAFGANWKRQGGAVPFSTTLSGFDFVVFEVVTSTYILYDLIRNPT